MGRSPAALASTTIARFTFTTFDGFGCTAKDAASSNWSNNAFPDQHSSY
jgi:hypothetical protein